MKILLVEPGKEPVLKEIDGSLKSMQEIVGGTIQALYPFEEPVALICNDEGKLLGLPLNRALRDEEGRIYDIVAGTFFLCGAPTDSDHLESIPEALVEKYQRRFTISERFLNLNEKLLCIFITDNSGLL